MSLSFSEAKLEQAIIELLQDQGISTPDRR